MYRAYSAREGGLRLSNPSAAVERFYAGLAKLTPRHWMSTITAFPVDEYERASGSGQEAMAAFVKAPTDPEAIGALAMAQETATEVVRDLWPDLATLRADMRPYTAPGAGELSQEAYDLLRSAARRRVLRAAAGVALAGVLTPAQLSGLYRPFEGFVPLSTVLNAPPDFERDLALALLTCSRWAVEQGPGSREEKNAYWQTVFPRWMWVFNGGESAGMGVPNLQISMGLMIAISSFLPDGGAKTFRYTALPLARDAESRVRDSPDEQIEEYLGQFRRWKLPRHRRRWIASRLVRVMEAMLTREGLDGTKTVEPRPESLTVTDRTLKAMGFEAADREPPPPPDGLLALPAALAGWSPTPIDLATHLSSAPKDASQTSVPPPEAQRRNTALVAEPDHFQSALDWYITSVMPFIDDYAPAPAGSPYPEIGGSRLSSAVPYERQPDEVRLLLWALADAMLVDAQAREASGQDSASRHLGRLPLIRTIWWEEVEAATRSTLGLRTGDNWPALGDPAFLDFFKKHADARDRVESGMHRLLKTETAGGASSVDGLSALQIAMAARAAARLPNPALASRTGCAASVLALGALGLTIEHLVRLLGIRS